MIYKQLHKFYLVEDHDALSLAYEALYNAIITYDVSKSCKLSTYATVCIYNALGSYVRKLQSQANLDTISYEVPIGEDGNTLLNKLKSDLTADREVLSDCGVSLIANATRESLETLTNPLHRKIVDSWVDSEFTLTQDRIAAMHGCTQSYVAQIIKRFKNTLKKKLEEKQ